MARTTCGRLLVVLSLVACAHKQTPTVAPIRFQGEASDVVGDALAIPGVDRPPDLVHATIRVTDDDIMLGVRFAPGTFDPATTAVTIQLDTDLDVKTGVPLRMIGVDYTIGLGKFAGDRATLSQATNGEGCPRPSAPCTYVVVTRWPVSFVDDGVDAIISRAAFRRFDGRLNFRVLAYVQPQGAQFSTTTDQLPDSRLAPAQVR
jgi:hypothetical protein